MITAALPPFTVVVGLDFRDAGGYAFQQAARVASAIAGSHVHLVHVFEKDLDEARRKELIGQLRLYANNEVATFGNLAGVSVGVHLRVGNPVREIVQLATDVGANMIVIGAHKGPHVKSWALGTVAERLLLTAPCSVLVAGPRPAATRHAPEIEPPCADCVRTRIESKRATWWCERHARHAARAHVFSYQRELPLATHDSEVIPTGIEF